MRAMRRWLTTLQLKYTLYWIIFDVLIMGIMFTIILSLNTVVFSGELVGLILLNIITMCVSLQIMGAYKRSLFLSDTNYLNILVAGLVMCFVLGIGLTLNGFYTILADSMFALLFAIIIMAMARHHRQVTNWVNSRRAGNESNAMRVLVVGTGNASRIIANQLVAQSYPTAYQLIGFIDEVSDHHNGVLIEGKPILASINQLIVMTHKHQIDMIIIAIDEIQPSQLVAILREAQNTQAVIKIVRDPLATIQTHPHHNLHDLYISELVGQSHIVKSDIIDITELSHNVIFVTGAAGSIGSELCRQLMLHMPKKLIMIDFNESALHDLYIELHSQYPNLLCIPVLLDVTHEAPLRKIFIEHQPNIVFHAAAYKHVPLLQSFPSEAIRVNIGGTLNVARLSAEYAVERFTLISTDKAVNPKSIMGATKRLCEQIVYCMAQQTHFTTCFTAVRFGNVIGSRGSVIPTFNQQIRAGGPVTVTHREMKRFFMSIHEAVQLVLHATVMTNGGEIFILQMGKEQLILDIAEQMIRLYGLRPYDDIDIEFIGIRSGEKLSENLYSIYEHIAPTNHPDIMQLTPPFPELYSASRLRHIAYLLEDNLPTDESALSYLLDLCYIEDEQTTVAS